MSQKAVSLRIDRLDELEILDPNIMSAYLPEGYEALEYIDNSLGASIDTGIVCDSTNFKVLGQWKRTGTCSTTGTPIIGYGGLNAYAGYGLYYTVGNGSSILAKAYSSQRNGTTVSLGADDIWHYFSLEWGKLMLDGKEYDLPTTGGTKPIAGLTLVTGSVMPMYLGIMAIQNADETVALMIPCKNGSIIGMYDVVRDLFITSSNNKSFVAGLDALSPGDKLVSGNALGQLIVQETGNSKVNLMSQKAVTDELIAAQVIKPSYFTGLMLTYLLEDYPMFDIRKCDGVSIVMDAIQYNLSRSSGNFVISKGTANGDTAFCIFQSWGNLRVGLYKSYGGTAVQGMAVNNGNNAYFSHRVYTVDFLTGVCKVYKNGVLVNTLTPSSYDYSVLKDFFDNTATRLSIGPGTRDAELKTSSMAVFGHVLTDDDVTDLYGNGSDSVCGNLIPDKWKANWLIPRIITNWGTQHYNATKTTHTDGGAIFTTNSTSGALLRFGFTGIPVTGENAVRGNIIYEWDFEVLSGSANANYSMRNGAYAYKSWKIIDSEGNELDDGTLVEAGNTYHVINKPNNLENDYYDSTGTSLHLGYVFDTPSSDFSIWVKPELKLTERGAAIVCGPDEYKDVYWEMPNGTHIPNNKTLNLWNVLGHNTLPITQGVHYGGFKDKAVIYSSSKLPQFNGQIAVDTVNGKVYIGYLTGTGGTWKQVSN